MEELVKQYERLGDLCRQQAVCVATEDTGRLSRILHEKGALLQVAAELLPRARAAGDAAGLERVLAAARAAAAVEEAAVQSLSANLDALRGRLRLAGDGRAALRSYRPGGPAAGIMDRYSG